MFVLKFSGIQTILKALDYKKNIILIVFISVSFQKLYTVKGYIFFPLPMFFKRKRKKRKVFNIFVISEILRPSYFFFSDPFLFLPKKRGKKERRIK